MIVQKKEKVLEAQEQKQLTQQSSLKPSLTSEPETIHMATKSIDEFKN